MARIRTTPLGDINSAYWGKESRKMTIPTQAQYEANEFALYQKSIDYCNAQSVADKREAMADYSAKLQDGEGFANSVNNILAGNYGFWIGKVANEVASNERMNRCAWLAQHVALSDHNCPHRYAVKAWKALPAKQQAKITKAIQKEIDFHNENQEVE